MPSGGDTGKALKRPDQPLRLLRRLLSAAAIGLAVLFLSAGLLAGGLYLYLRGDAGLERLANLLEEIVSEPVSFFLASTASPAIPSEASPWKALPWAMRRDPGLP